MTHGERSGDLRNRSRENNAPVWVVIPTTGRASLARAVRSALEQSVPTQVVVVHDGPEFCGNPESLGPRDRVSVVRSGGGRGGAICRQMGLDAAVGPLVAFLDDDDWWEPNKLETQLNAMAVKQGQSAFSTTGTVFHMVTGSNLYLPRTKSQPRHAGALFSALLRRRNVRHNDYFLQTSSLLLNKEACRDVSWRANLSKHQDWMFLADLVSKVGIEGWTHAPECLTHVVQGSPDSLSKSFQPDVSLQVADFLRGEFQIQGRSYLDFWVMYVLRSYAYTGPESIIFAVRELFLQIWRMKALPHAVPLLLVIYTWRSQRRTSKGLRA